jgi:hypothetical protein
MAQPAAANATAKAAVRTLLSVTIPPTSAVPPLNTAIIADGEQHRLWWPSKCARKILTKLADQVPPIPLTIASNYMRNFVDLRYSFICRPRFMQAKKH